MNKNISLGLGVLIALLGIGWGIDRQGIVDLGFPGGSSAKSKTVRVDKIKSVEKEMRLAEEIIPLALAQLLGDGVGQSEIWDTDDIQKIETSITNLANLEEGFFYEGWVITEDPEEVISTGEFENRSGLWKNKYELELGRKVKDFVLTLEPRDDNPAPSDVHVVEGEYYYTGQ